MRSLSPEQIVLFLLVIGLPLLKSIAGVIRKRNLSSPQADAASRDNEQEPSWLRGHNENLPWSRSTEEKPIPPAPPVTLRPAPWEVPKVAAPLRPAAIWQTAAAPLERPVPPAAARKKQPQPPIARSMTSSLLRQIRRDPIGQRRAIVLMAVFGPPRAIDPPP